MLPDPIGGYCQCRISSEFHGIKLKRDSRDIVDVKESYETDRQTDGHRWEGLEQTVSSAVRRPSSFSSFSSRLHSIKISSLFHFNAFCIFLAHIPSFVSFLGFFFPTFVPPLSLNNSCLLFEVGFFFPSFFPSVSAATYLFIFGLHIFFVRLLPCLP